MKQIEFNCVLLGFKNEELLIVFARGSAGVYVGFCGSEYLMSFSKNQSITTLNFNEIGAVV